MNNVFRTILNYLNQPSTYKGLFALLAAFGVVMSPELSNAIIACALGIIGLVDVIVNEHKTYDDKPEN